MGISRAFHTFAGMLLERSGSMDQFAMQSDDVGSQRDFHGQLGSSIWVQSRIRFPQTGSLLKRSVHTFSMECLLH